MNKFFLFLPIFLFGVSNNIIEIYKQNFSTAPGVKEINGYYYILSKDYVFKRMNKQRLILKSKVLLMKYLKDKYHKNFSSMILKGFEPLMVWKKNHNSYMFSRIKTNNISFFDNRNIKKISSTKYSSSQNKKIEKFELDKIKLNKNKLSDLYLLKDIYFIKGDMDQYNKIVDKIMELKFLKDNNEKDNFNF